MEDATKIALDNLGNYLKYLATKEDISKEDIKELIGKTFEVLRDKDIKKKLPMLNDFNLAMVKGIILGKLK